MMAPKYSSAKNKSFDFDSEEDKVQKQENNEDFQMFLDEHKSSGSHHSTSKSKAKKNNKPTVSRKESLEIKGTFDPILVAITSF